MTNDINDFLSMSNEDILKENNGHKFSIILMNPPYQQRIHLKFLKKIIEVSNKVISIQPINWLTNLTDRNKDKSSYYKYENSISKYISDIDKINTHEAKKFFNGIQVPDLGIYICDKIGGYDYKNKLIDPIIKKINEFINNNLCNSEYNKKDGWRVRLPKSISLNGSGERVPSLHGLGRLIYFYNGEKNGKKWYNFYKKNQNSKFTDEITRSIKFDTEEEANNFCKSFDTDFCKYIENFIITDMRLDDDRILWMGNAKHPRTGKFGYKSEWTNEDFYEFFDVNKELQDKIETFIRNYKESYNKWMDEHKKKYK